LEQNFIFIERDTEFFINIRVELLLWAAEWWARCLQAQHCTHCQVRQHQCSTTWTRWCTRNT